MSHGITPSQVTPRNHQTLKSAKGVVGNVEQPLKYRWTLFGGEGRVGSSWMQSRPESCVSWGRPSYAEIGNIIDNVFWCVVKSCSVHSTTLISLFWKPWAGVVWYTFHDDLQMTISANYFRNGKTISWCGTSQTTEESRFFGCHRTKFGSQT